MSELKKLIAVKDKSQTIGEFLEWLQEEDYVLSFWVERGQRPHTWYELSPLGKSVEQLLAEYFEIDLDKVEHERRVLLEKLTMNRDENPYNINTGQYLDCPVCGRNVICYSESNDKLICDSCGCSVREDRWNNRVCKTDDNKIYITHPVTGEPMDKSMCKRVITQLFEQREALEKQLDQLHDQIMNLPCPEPAILLSEEQHLLVKTGHKYARHQAAELVAGIGTGKEHTC